MMCYGILVSVSMSYVCCVTMYSIFLFVLRFILSLTYLVLVDVLWFYVLQLTVSGLSSL